MSPSSPIPEQKGDRPNRLIRWAAILLLLYGIIETGDCLTVIAMQWGTVYYFYPLPLPLPRAFPWPWPISVLIGLVILIPAMYLLVRGSKDAGEETLKPRPEHEMYSGIYEKMRHPQAAGESVTWLGGAFLLNSPFLALYSLIWLPIYYLMCRAEEKDLVLRFGQDYVDYMQRVGFLWPKKPTK